MLREEHRLRVLEIRVLRRIFGPKRDELSGGWRKLPNEEFHNLYSSPSITRTMKSRTMRWSEHVGRPGQSRNANTVFVGTSEGSRLLRRLRSRWEDTIKMDLREI
jgi:hypothetical protein